jgi:DNA-binding IclR family transcriptional regulator
MYRNDMRAERADVNGPAAEESMEDRGSGIQVIARAAAVLRELGAHPGGLSLAEIAVRLGLARSTVQRIVQALEAEGFVETRGPRGGFLLGPALARLVYRRQIDIVSVARPFIEALSVELSETVALCMLSGDEVTTLDRVVAERVLRVVFPLGTIPRPARDLAPGQVMLAELAGEAAQGRLAQIRASGRAMDRNDEFTGFAVALRNPFGLHALTVVVPSTRSDGQEARIFSALETCRDAIVQRLDPTD